MIQDTINKFVSEVMDKRTQVIDDFCKVYLASRADFFKQDIRRLTRIELCIKKNTDGLGETMWFRIRPGRLKGNPSESTTLEKSILKVHVRYTTFALGRKSLA